MMDSNIQAALNVLVPAMQPEEIYLYGSRARGDAKEHSDYDFFVVMPDNAPKYKIDLFYTHSLTSSLDICADVTPCRKFYFEKDKSLLGTLGYNVAHEGKRIYARA